MLTKLKNCADANHGNFTYNFLNDHKWWTSRSSLLPVVAAAREAACDAGPSEGCGAGVVAHIVPLGGAHATALHVAPTDTEARQAADTRSIS